MTSVDLSRVSLKRLLSAKRQIRQEFGKVLHLSDPELLHQLNHYLPLTTDTKTRELLQACLEQFDNDGTTVDPHTKPNKKEQAKASDSWSPLSNAVSYFD